MWIDRDWTTAVAALTRAFPAVLLTGPRQVGKTALLRHQFPHATYVSFDDPALARQAETHPTAFWDSLREPLIIDEVQYVPSIFRRLKQRIDADRRPGRFLLTGSQTFSLMQNVSESLAGRCGLLEMSTLSLAEARGAQPSLDSLAFLVTGGFPALHAGEFENPGDFYSSYLATYLERDVRNLKAVGSLRDFDRFLRACAIRTGQILSYSDLAGDVGIAPNTARAWLSVMQASGQIFLLEPYHRNQGKRLVKSPKLYFMDTGLACRLAGITDRAALLASPLAGAFWETLVIGQVVRHFQIQREKPPLWFWRTLQGPEIDLLVERGGRFIAIECKLGEAPDEDATRAFNAFSEDYGKGALGQALVVCRTLRKYGLKSFSRASAVGIEQAIEALRGS
jgi:uncharacterized protein